MSETERRPPRTTGQYWWDREHRRKPLVDLGGVRCPRCPRPIRAVPADKVTVVAYPAAGGHVRRFVCPHCRGLTGGRVGSVEAARLVAAGAVMTCAGPPASPLTEDELIAFGRSTAGASDLARLAVDG